MKRYYQYLITYFVSISMIVCIFYLSEIVHTDKIQKSSVSISESRERPKAALTFDDGPNSKYTSILLKGLRERGIKASFFIMGKNIKGNESLLKEMFQDGHLIGNHTYNHVQLNKVSVGKAKEEIVKTSNEIYQITGYYPVYVRPPFGEWRKDLEFEITMLPVLWDIDTLDWKSKNEKKIVETVIKQIQDDSIILMHDGYETSVNAALQIADILIQKGYELVTVDRLLVM